MLLLQFSPLIFAHFTSVSHLRFRGYVGAARPACKAYLIACLSFLICNFQNLKEIYVICTKKKVEFYKI